MDATLDRITIYPIKSLPGCEVTEVAVLPGGALENDRRYALVDEAGESINGKRVAAIGRVQATYSESVQRVLLTYQEQQASFSLVHDQQGIGNWFRQMLNIPCHLIENSQGGFPDDTDAPGPTLITTASLLAVAGWYEGLTLAEARLRFRANLEVSGTEPFWEDCLVGDAGPESRFSIGDTTWHGHSISQRCVVPTRDSKTGQVSDHFARIFATNRARQLPAWSPRDVFDHFYRLAINLRLVSNRPDVRQGPRILHVGDRVADS